MAVFFLRSIAVEFGRDVAGFTDEALDVIQAHTWPGNVREMIACIRRAVVMGSERLITVADLAIQPRQAAARGRVAPPRLAPGSDKERDVVRQALERHRQNITKAAQELGVSRVTFYRMLKRHSQES